MIKRGAAGFLIGKRDENQNWLFLALFAPLEKRINRSGMYDIPKGARKAGETFLECAKRECFEETRIQIRDNQITGECIKIDNIAIYPAVSDNDPIIEPNPETGILEHDGFEWVSRDSICEKSLDYLRPHIISCIRSYFV